MRANDQKYIEELKRYLGDEGEVYLCWKARVGLFNLLRAMGIGFEDEVVLPGFTCVVVSNAILYLGAKPVYVDVSPHTFNMPVRSVESAINERTKVIICQNTFGLSSDLEEIQQLATARGISTIEDCTHGFGGTYNSRPNGSTCDAAFFSTQWSKPFSTGVGGFCTTRNADIANKMTKFTATLKAPTIGQSLNLQSLIWFRRYILRSWNYWSMVRLYRFLSRHNIVVGSSSGQEIDTIEVPADYLTGFGKVQQREALMALKHFPELQELRKNNAAVYTSYLIEKGKNHVSPELVNNHGFLRYPLLVFNRDTVLELAEKNRIQIGDWFVSPLYPIRSDLTKWDVDVDTVPNAVAVSKHIINLPTDTENPQKVIDFLQYIDQYIVGLDEYEKLY